MSQSPPPIPTAQPPAAENPPVIPGPLRAGQRPHRGGLILGLGIASLGIWLLSLVGSMVIPCCGMSGLISLGMAIPAWIMANADLAAMNAGAMDPLGRGSTEGGKICAIISVVIHILAFLAIVILAILGIAFFAATAPRGGP
jgi:hypothetical protein